MPRQLVLWSILALGCGEATMIDVHAARRERMVREQLVARGIRDEAVLSAMRAVPRERFVPPEWIDDAYEDGPLPLGDGQTISQPYVVAWMTELSGAETGSRVLEIDTGSGYQAAILAAMGAEVWTIEIVPSLGHRAHGLLGELGYAAEDGGRVHTRIGDGSAGWPEAAPFDVILLTAAPEEIPAPLLAQLRIGGRLVAPVGERATNQELWVVTRTESGLERQRVGLVRFVPMTGGAGRD